MSLHVLVPPSRPSGERADVQSAASSPQVRTARVTRTDAAALSRLIGEHALARAAAAPVPARTELTEALFEPPLRAWAWLAWVDGAAAGYAGATASFSWSEQAYFLAVEAVYVRAGLHRDTIVSALLAQARWTAHQLGCSHLQWQLPSGLAPPAAVGARPAQTRLYRLSLGAG
ncbi:MAG TPA: hypothetical protein VMR06_06150 [Dokdonella sp.]|uniref:hypothetical protein n=1 Tax=Dokdonella sp. TaxID=2291710 RepID=UPI002BC65C43|nr:hypothetical protein [Dokdonella sp.]HUD41567.1 hypothetical protein [Dokdonella sp.]